MVGLQDLPPEALAQIKAAQEKAKLLSQQAAAGMRPMMSMAPQMEPTSAVVAAAQAAASQIAQKASPLSLLDLPQALLCPPGAQQGVDILYH